MGCQVQGVAFKEVFEGGGRGNLEPWEEDDVPSAAGQPEERYKVESWRGQ